MTKQELIEKADEFASRNERFSIKPVEFFEFIKEVINLLPENEPEDGQTGG